MRMEVWGVVAVASLGVVGAADADIYLRRDRFGVLHFTNAPADSTARLVIKEPSPSPLAASPASGVLGGWRSSAYDGLIREIADRHDVEYALVKAIIKAESDFDRLAVSPKGARGLMQLMPATAAELNVRNAFAPRDNIDGGCRYLRVLLERYGGNLPLAVAAYNAGIRRVEEAGGVPPIRETRAFVARVLRYRLAYRWEDSGVLATRR
jgi:soluble lytic murein transglycosylase-like protein